MISHIRRQGIAYTALFAALSGTAWAAANVGARDIRPDAVRAKHIKAAAVRASEIASGAVGPEQAALYSGSLRSGQTMRGTYIVHARQAATGSVAGGAISFPFPLESAPQIHEIGEGATPPAACPGTAAAPAADPGHLCLFEADNENANLATPAAPAGAASARFGVVVTANPAGGTDTGETISSRGTWAVTAP